MSTPHAFPLPHLRGGRAKENALQLKSQEFNAFVRFCKGNFPCDSDESLLAAWAGGRPPGSSGEIDWKENTWLNLLPRLTWHPSTPVCRYHGSGYTDKRYPKGSLHKPSDFALGDLLYLIPSGFLMGECRTLENPFLIISHQG